MTPSSAALCGNELRPCRNYQQRQHPSRASSPHSYRCAAAGSRRPAADTPLAWTAQKDRAAATLPPAGSPHQTSRRRPPEPTRGSRTKVSPGARAQRNIQHAHAPPDPDNPERHLTADRRISKRVSTEIVVECSAPISRPLHRRRLSLSVSGEMIKPRCRCGAGDGLRGKRRRPVSRLGQRLLPTRATIDAWKPGPRDFIEDHFGHAHGFA